MDMKRKMIFAAAFMGMLALCTWSTIALGNLLS